MLEGLSLYHYLSLSLSFVCVYDTHHKSNKQTNNKSNILQNSSNSNHFRYIFQLHYVYGRVVSRFNHFDFELSSP